ncbi:MAG: WxcM-like domain-containing protein [Rhodanobacteraceae bacterium]|nr:WxcM-like domain-containing protein [Rhodanobacteraceae bacterium]
MTDSNTPYIHALADVQSDHIGNGTKIWQFVVILPGARIGRDVNVCSHCFIENDVVVGDRVTIKNGVQLGMAFASATMMFIGPNATFTNDKFPRSKQHLDRAAITEIEVGASIGAGATILPSIRIGRHAMVGAGAVVTRSVPPNAIVIGNPARIVGYSDSGRVQDKQNARNHGPSETAPASRVNGVSLVSLPKVTDIRGSLTVGEFERSVPFPAKRYFIVFDVPSIETRGEHAHKACHQFLICVRGSVTVMADDGVHREQHLLDRPDRGIHLPR